MMMMEEYSKSQWWFFSSSEGNFNIKKVTDRDKTFWSFQNKEIFIQLDELDKFDRMTHA